MSNIHAFGLYYVNYTRNQRRGTLDNDYPPCYPLSSFRTSLGAESLEQATGTEQLGQPSGCLLRCCSYRALDGGCGLFLRRFGSYEA